MKNHNRLIVILFLCLTCSSAFGSQTHSINLLLAESESLVFGDLGAVSVNDFLVFERNVDGVESIWSYHMQTHSLTPLNIINATNINVYRNQAVIETTDDGNDAVFVSDGTPSETFLLARESELVVEFTEQAIYMLAAGFWSSTVYRYNGQNTTKHDMRGSLVFNPKSNTNVCEFDDGSFEVLLNIRNFQGGVNYTQFAGRQVGLYAGDYLQINNVLGHCFVSSYYGLSFVYQPQSGLKRYADSELAGSLANFTELNGSLYAIEIADNQSFYKLHQLNIDSLESINSTQINLIDGYTTSWNSPPSLFSIGDALLVSYNELLLFDNELMPLPLDQSNHDQPQYFSPQTEVYHNPSFTLLAEKHPLSLFYGTEQQNPELTYLSNQKFDAYFSSTKNLRLDQIIIDQSSQAANLTAFDFNTQKLGYYLIEDQPKISQQINGIWFNNELANQGFSISKGIRQNRSEYVFVTAYLFRNGAPLWLAGNADIDGTSETLTLDLYEYDGPLLFEPSQTANRKLFGQASLELMSCHSLAVQLTADGQTNQLLLNRANNTAFQNWCQE